MLTAYRIYPRALFPNLGNQYITKHNQNPKHTWQEKNPSTVYHNHTSKAGKKKTALELKGRTAAHPQRHTPQSNTKPPVATLKTRKGHINVFQALKVNNHQRSYYFKLNGNGNTFHESRKELLCGLQRWLHFCSSMLSYFYQCYILTFQGYIIPVYSHMHISFTINSKLPILAWGGQGRMSVRLG